jgi:hypothetical protein
LWKSLLVEYDFKKFSKLMSRERKKSLMRKAMMKEDLNLLIIPALYNKEAALTAMTPHVRCF